MKKKTITKSMIMAVYCKTLDTIPHLEVKGTSHFGRMVEWFELEGYNITATSITNISNYIQRRKVIMKELSELALNDFNNNVKGK